MSSILKSNTKAEDIHAKARKLMECKECFTTLWTQDIELIDANDVALQLFEVDKQTFLNSFFDFFPTFQLNGKPSIPTALSLLKKALNDGFCTFDWSFIKNNCKMFSGRIAIVRHHVEGNRYLVSYATEIKYQTNENFIQQNYENIELLLKHLPIGVDYWNKNFKLLDCAESSLRLFGLNTKQEYIDNFHALSPEFQPNGEKSCDLIPKHLAIALRERHHRFEWLHLTKTGEELPVEVILVCVNSAGEDIVIAYYKDLREIKQSIKKTKKLQQRMKHILNAAPYSIVMWDENAKPIDCNTVALAFFGFDSKEDFFNNYHCTLPTFKKSRTHDSEIIMKLFDQVFKEGYAFFEGDVRHAKNDEVFFVEVVLRKITIDDEVFAISYLNDLTYQKFMLNEIVESHRAVSIARDEAEKSTRVKSEFLANMSHEIRTPMNGILGLIHLLGYTKLQEQQKEYIQKIRYSAESLLRIINDILDFSKIEAGMLEIENATFSLAQIQEDLYAIFAAKFTEKNLHVEILQQDICKTMLIGDSLRLKQVFINLIGNAIKFTEQGSIIVDAKLDIDHDNSNVVCHFCVADTGIGLSEEHCKRLFNAFSQADTSTTRKYGGTGLGLAISKNILEIMNGTIWVESQLGKGSKFFFTAQFGLDQTVEQEKKYITEFYHTTHEQIKAGTALEGASMPSLFGYILLVEDNEINQLIANELLSIKGHKVDIANNGQEALDMINKNNYDIVLMDIQMPIMDGLTATQKIRQNAKFNELPIIAMSAHAMKGDREISISHGMNDHLPKPISPDELYACLNVWLSKKQMLP